MVRSPDDRVAALPAVHDADGSPRVRTLLAIPTFRRPAQLAALLERLRGILVPAGMDVDVVVLDNDDRDSARAAVAATGTDFPFALRYQHVPEPGLSVVRNATLRLAEREYDLLAMIDDDELPCREWLSELARVAELTGADGVVGPVPPIVPDDAPAWIRRGTFYDIETLADAAPMRFGYTGNCLLRTSAIRRYAMSFDAALNFAGGEDMLFFRQFLARGATLVFAAGAVAVEAIPASRLTLSYIVRLDYRRGNTLAFCDRLVEGSRAKSALRALKSVALITLGLACALPLSIARGKTGAVMALCRIAKGLGGLAGLQGHAYHAYRRTSL